MGATKIEWADCLWNPVVACRKVSPACNNCYAERMAYRLACMGQDKYRAVVRGEGIVEDVDREGPLHGRWNGDVFLDESALADPKKSPLHWRKPRTIFVVSMGDLFYERVPFEFIDRIFAVMAMCPQHTFLLLTKRPERAREYLTTGNAPHYPRLTDIEIVMESDHGWVSRDDLANIAPAGSTLPRDLEWPLPNVWLGVTAENQEQADKRIPILLKTPAAKRFVSVEPMLGPVDLMHVKWARIPVRDEDYHRHGVPTPEEMWSTNNVLRARTETDIDNGKIGLDWVICGGESGPGARPMHPQWPRGLRDQCVAAGAPFLFKQWGKWSPSGQQGEHCFNPGASIHDIVCMSRVGKKAAGRLLDGKLWDQRLEVTR